MSFGGNTQQFMVIEVTTSIHKALDNKKTCGNFIDLQKAFDMMNHSILVNKLNHYGIRGIANNWFKSYLSNRSQFDSIQCPPGSQS